MLRIAAKIPAPIGIPRPRNKRSKDTTFLNEALTCISSVLFSGVVCDSAFMCIDMMKIMIRSTKPI